MRLLRRNVGQLILASALVHDTVGWLILGVVASLASSGSIEIPVVAKTVLGTAVFLGLSATAGRPAVRRLLRWVNDHLHAEQALLTTVVVLMLLAAAVTQAIGVHAVLGAFVMGILLRESPLVTERVLHPLEAVTTAIFAPIFFAAAGLHVNLVLLANPVLLLMAAVLTGAACLGKVAGCYLGARWAGVDHWPALSVGIGTNARGAMGLIVGVLGFSLGILTVDMFSMIVLMAVVTTAMTPPLLRWTLRHVQPAREEEERLQKEALRARSFIGRLQRVLLPTRGGADAPFAGTLLGAVARHQPLEITALYAPTEAHDAHAAPALAAARERIAATGASFHGIQTPPGPPDAAILTEAARGYDLLALGCGPTRPDGVTLFGEFVDRVARVAPVPLLVVRAGQDAEKEIRLVLLPTATSAHSVHAAELAIAIARTTGARILALHVYEQVAQGLFWLADHERRAEEAGIDLLEQVRSLGEAYGVPVETRLLRSDHAGDEIVRTAREQGADLIVMGGSARPTRNLFLGATVSTVLTGADCAVAVLRP
jgi:nucleotide-binding universal stress UspA family protein